jgi:Arc/MetJ-type ribon-helix-helix transcriptional regulator
MICLTIALPETAKAYVDRQIAEGNYNSVDEFLTVLIEQEQERQAKQKVNTTPFPLKEYGLFLALSKLFT